MSSVRNVVFLEYYTMQKVQVLSNAECPKRRVLQNTGQWKKYKYPVMPSVRNVVFFRIPDNGRSPITQ
jgi:hypothetical protein